MELHYIQMMILRELLLNSSRKFTDLNVKKMPSDQFTYHIKTLINLDLISKNKSYYQLTPKGKEFANTMDTDKYVLEKQGKISVLIIATRKRENSLYLLTQKRLKEPYMGFRGFISGKARFGETVINAAKRELKEETGLAGKFKFKYILHELIYLNKIKLIEDKYFYVLQCTKTKGRLIDIKEGENKWIEMKELFKTYKLFYDVKYILKNLLSNKNIFRERKYFIDAF